MNWQLTNASSKVGVQLISEKRLWQLTEIQLQCSSNGIYVHLSHHDRHVFVVCAADETTRLDVSCNSRHSVDSHLLHPSSLNLLHTLSHNKGNLGALSPREDTVTQKQVLKGLLTNKHII
uniref:Uncharacterized protein n=1 Tax=Lates calcarifer TaxID=8187 RepID=A0A4W6G998_LATCA